MKTIEEHFSKTTQSSLYNKDKDMPNARQLTKNGTHHLASHEILHYSTS